jgi:imidazolonepropionase-like amidohydrolase
VSSIRVRAPAGWLGPGRAVRFVAVVAEAGVVTYAGPRAAAPAADQDVEVDGFLLPAVADRHVHIGLADPAAVQQGGVTAVRDLGWPPDRIFALADASELPTYRGPLIRAVGPLLTGHPDGYPSGESYAPDGMALELRGAEHAAEVVVELAGRGATAIKVAMNSERPPTPTDAELTAVCSTAGDLGVPVTAHVQGAGQVPRALGAGVDELAHAPWTERLSDDVIQAAAGRVRIVSTLDVLARETGASALQIALDNLRRFVAAGGELAYGTDMGAKEWGVPWGIDVREALLLREAGLEPEGVLGAMMRAPLEVGAPGDIIVLGGDPREELEALDDLRLVVRGGRVVAAG